MLSSAKNSKHNGSLKKDAEGPNPQSVKLSRQDFHYFATSLLNPNPNSIFHLEELVKKDINSSFENGNRNEDFRQEMIQEKYDIDPKDYTKASETAFLDTIEYYVNGFSTSLPEDIQYKALKLVAGFENVKFFRPGYAIEYDYFPPTQLRHTLETKLVEGLYFAGQINGTTGYEEAASQGLMAGMNAALKVQEKEDFILTRSEAYIGVLIDDLITKGTEEPYRMFTSRAEYRTLLRQDNADFRLTAKSFGVGLASSERMKVMEEKKKKSETFVEFFKNQSVTTDEINPILESKKSSKVDQQGKLFKILARPNIVMEDMRKLESVKKHIVENNLGNEVLEQVEVQVKYAGYIEKEKLNADKLNRLENVKIPEHFNYNGLKSMSLEAREKLTKIKPRTISQASRVSGVNPSDVSVLLVHMGR